MGLGFESRREHKNPTSSEVGFFILDRNTLTMKNVLITLLVCLITSCANAQTDTVEMNDGKIVSCTITASNSDYLSVVVDSTDYLVEKKYVKQYTLNSKTQRSLVVENMDYEHSGNIKYAGLGHPLQSLKYNNPIAVAGRSLIAMASLWVVGGTLTAGGAVARKPVLSYMGGVTLGVSLVPLIVAGAKLIEAGERNKKRRFIR